MRKITRTAVYSCQAALLTALSTGVLAAPADDDIKFAGFASFVYAKTLSDDKEGSFNGISGEGTERDFNKFGLRMDADLKDNLMFTAQLLAEGSNDYDPDVDWMFATIKLQPGLKLSAGKMRMPLFQYSDYLNVGYAYQWVAPPSSVYDDGFDALDGLKLTYLTDIGDWTSELQIWSGSVEETKRRAFVGPIEEHKITIDDTYGIVWSMDYDWLGLRAVWGTGDSSSGEADRGVDLVFQGLDAQAFQPLEAGVNAALVPVPVATALDLSSLDLTSLYMDKSEVIFTGLAVSMDFGSYFVLAEATSIDIDESAFAGDNDQRYITVGTRLPNSWTVSLTYETQEITVDSSAYKDYLADFDNLVSSYQGFNPGLDQGIAGVRAGVVQGIETLVKRDWNAWTATARWDFHKQAAMKLEYIQREDTLTDQEPNALRVGLDLVF